MSFLRKFIDITISVVGNIKRNHKVYPDIDEHDGLIKVNLGCGLRVCKGWLNVDGSLNAMLAPWPKFVHKIVYKLSGSQQYYSLNEYCDILENNRFLYHDLAFGLPLHNNSIDFIYSSHFFEHLFKDDAANLLSDCLNALKPGGVIRISIPDLSYALSLYNQGKKDEMLDDYFFVEGKGSYLARHKYMYDFELIKNVLEDVGFSGVTRCQYQQGRVPDIDFLDVYPDISLFVEAISSN
ncbi:MAG: methyltransferase domain-containing protein [Gammaproteobacteria bacterium]|jgi:predicted SAM-dependent methyltransferase|nr:methyltransferase domain-containing protein [Gammaproteobacteria bacterium]MBT4146374.1 methyltransferase domain-containing protein [Gammaproteobacteria bacterium]